MWLQVLEEGDLSRVVHCALILFCCLTSWLVLGECEKLFMASMSICGYKCC